MGTAAVVLAIYATLGLRPAIAGALRDRDLLGVVFALGTLLIWVSVFTQGLRVRPRGREVGVALGVAAAYLMVFVRMSIPEERTHLIEYGVVAMLIHEALEERRHQGRRVRRVALTAVALASLLGGLDEAIQATLPNRVFAPRDILFNVLAAGMAVASLRVLGWVRRGRERRASR